MRVLVVIAKGSEEIEAVAIIDTLRRAKIDVTVCGLDDTNPIEMSRGVVMVPDAALPDVAETVFDAVVLPGGAGGARAFAQSSLVGNVLRRHTKQGKIVAAICAAPMALAAHGIGTDGSPEGVRTIVTSHPSVKDQLLSQYTYSEDRVVVDGQLVTSRGPGTAIEMALTLIRLLLGNDARQSVAGPMMLYPGQA